MKMSWFAIKEIRKLISRPKIAAKKTLQNKIKK